MKSEPLGLQFSQMLYIILCISDLTGTRKAMIFAMIYLCPPIIIIDNKSCRVSSCQLVCLGYLWPRSWWRHDMDTLSALMTFGGPAITWIILSMGPANESRRYNVTSSLIGSFHTQNDSCTGGFSSRHREPVTRNVFFLARLKSCWINSRITDDFRLVDAVIWMYIDVDSLTQLVVRPIFRLKSKQNK